MPEQLLNSFLGMPSTKELPAAGLLKTGNSSLQANQNSKGENSFIAKLANSMKNASTPDVQGSTLTPSELENISSKEEINHLIDIASMDAPTNIATNIQSDQMPLYQVLNHDIPVEVFTNGIVNNTDNGKASPVQTQANTSPGHTLTGNQGSSAFNEQNVADILNKLNPAKIAATTGEEPPSQSSTAPGKQIAESHKGANTNSLNVQSDTNKSSSQEQTPVPSVNNFNTKTNEQNPTDILNKLIPAKIAGTTGVEPPSQASTTPDKQIAESLKVSNTNSLNVQLDINKNSSQEQTPAPSGNNINTKINEQNETGILSKLNSAKIAGTTGEEPPSQASKAPGKQIAESLKESNTNHDNQNNKNIAKINKLNAAGVLNKLNPTKTGATAGGEPPSQASTIPGKQIAESHKGFSTNQNNAKINNQNMANNTGKPDNAPTIEKPSSEQAIQASKTSDSSTNSLSQSNSKPAQTESNESQKIFDIRPDSAGAIVSKSPDTTTAIINSGVNSVKADEVLLPLNTSSNNSSFNNQAADTPNESYINAVNTSQKAEPGKNFTSTLSQINNSTKPFESLGRDTADNIIQKARLFMAGGKSEIKIQLNPPELGILRLEFEIEDDNLEVKIKVERTVVKDIIEKDIPRLRELLSNSDVDVGKLDVSLQEKEDEKLSLMDKDLQSDSENDNTKDLQDQDSEFPEDGIDEESIEYDEDSGKINFLV